MSTQDYICKLLSKHHATIPEELLSQDFGDRLSEINFELPTKALFERYVNALNQRYPNRFVIPFAKAVSNDQTVGIMVNEGTVIEFHDFAEQGFEQPRFFDSIAMWFATQRPS